MPIQKPGHGWQIQTAIRMHGSDYCYDTAFNHVFAGYHKMYLWQLKRLETGPFVPLQRFFFKYLILSQPVPS